MNLPVLAVGAVIRRQDSLLLVKRGRPPGEGLWSLPGGKVEPGESPREALRREVTEECGIAVEVGDLIGWVERSGPGYHFLILDYEAACGSEVDPVAGDDADEVAFVGRSELGALGLVEGLVEFLSEHGI